MEYILGIIFEDILGVDFKIHLSADGLDENIGSDALFYLSNPPTGKSSVFCSGYLTSQDLLPPFQFPTGFSVIPDPANVDIFAWAFYRLSMADRIELENAPTDVSDGDYQILIEDIATDLGRRLQLSPKPRIFDYEITIDVDNPWKHRYKPFHIRWGGLLKDFISRNSEGLRERRSALFKKIDPFDTDELIKEWCPPGKTTLFYLVDGDHPNDSRFNLRMKPYADRVRAMKAAGFGIGIHPSYESHLDPEMIKAQKSLLESVAGPINRSRQHFLRYTLPQTFRYLHAEGIRQEYSICPKDFTGPLTSIARPYPWYDISREESTSLTMVPAVVMDRSLQQYMGLSPDQALIKIRKEIKAVRRVGGKFVIILHNETFSESGEWKGWREVIRQMLEDLQANGS